MQLRTLSALAVVTACALLLPATSLACSSDDLASHPYGYFGTPYSAKGRFVFVTKVSRRVLWQEVALHQRPLRPMLQRTEI